MIQNKQTSKHQLGALTGANKCENYYELYFNTGEVARFYILAAGIFRFLLDPEQNFDDKRSPLGELKQFDNTAFNNSQVSATRDSLIIQSGNYQIIFGQKPAVMSIFDETIHRTRMVQAKPLELANNATSEFLVQNKNEFYFGGGLQNGYFSHKGHKIEIARNQIPGQGGVPLQVPFFWSSSGYGELRNTTQIGTYDFGQNEHNLATIMHRDQIFDNFYLLGATPQKIIAKYYALTGKPLLLPKYALGLGHIGNFCSTLWQPSKASNRNATRLGNNYYTRTNIEENAIGKASLNGEEDYQFSARNLIDRYQMANLHLNWLVPNYKASLPNLPALKFFNDYALQQDVHPGFWHKEPLTLPEKSAFTFTNNFELINSDNNQLATKLKPKRSLVLSDNGFMGMQKKAALIFAGIGGNWENIAIQVAGMLGANLSGQPLVGAAIDGAQGGGNAQIYVRDFEWKTFTPLLFNLDDQGSFSKTPFTYNKKITELNQSYLKLHNKLKNYLFTLNVQANLGFTMMRPLFLAFPEQQFNYTDQFASEFMLGDNFLIAPITNGREDDQGNTRKDNLYLPDSRTIWIDFLTGQKYAGGRVYNNLSYPLWNLPVFVRGGSILDLGQRDFVIYPQGSSETTIYADSDLTDFKHNHCETHIQSTYNDEKLVVTLDPIKGNYPGFNSNQETKLTIMCDTYPDHVTVKINDQIVPVQEYGTIEAFNHAHEGIFYNTNYVLPEFSSYQKQRQTALQIKLASRELANTKIEITIQNLVYGNHVLFHAITSGLLSSPKLPAVDSSKITAHSFELAWPQQSSVQVEINHLIYEGITGKSFTFHELSPNTRYIIRMRYVSGSKVSEWSDLFGVITKPAAISYAIQDIQTTCNFESSPQHPLAYLTDLKLSSEWQSNQPITEDNPLQLTFTFKEIQKLSRMVFVPRNIDHDGDPTDISLAISTDGENYTIYADHLKWKVDSKNKVIGLRDVRAKAIRLTIYHTAGAMVAAREILFYRAKK